MTNTGARNILVQIFLLISVGGIPRKEITWPKDMLIWHRNIEWQNGRRHRHLLLAITRLVSGLEINIPWGRDIDSSWFPMPTSPYHLSPAPCPCSLAGCSTIRWPLPRRQDKNKPVSCFPQILIAFFKAQMMLKVDLFSLCHRSAH